MLNIFKSKEKEVIETAKPRDFKSELRKRISILMKKYPSPTEYLKEEYGLNEVDIANYEFKNLDDLELDQYIVEKIRGSIPLGEKKILTKKDSNKIIDKYLEQEIK